MELDPRVIGRIISSTKTRKRPYDLVQVANDVQLLKNETGSLEKVSELIAGVSPGMLNQFLSVLKLNEQVQSLLQKRTIDGVAVAFNLSKLPDSDQLLAAQMLLSGELTNQDLRLLSPLRKQYPDFSLRQLVQKLIETQNKKVSVIQFNPDELKITITELKSRIVELIGDTELLYVDVDLIRITPTGEKMLRQIAKKKRKTLSELIYNILQK